MHVSEDRVLGQPNMDMVEHVQLYTLYIAQLLHACSSHIGLTYILPYRMVGQH